MFTRVADTWPIHPEPNTPASEAGVDFYIPAGAKSCLAHMLHWTGGGFVALNWCAPTARRFGPTDVTFYGPGEHVMLPEGDVLSSRQVVVTVGHIAGPRERIRFQGRWGGRSTSSVSHCKTMCCPRHCRSCTPENIIGDPASLSVARLTTEVTSVSGDQALSVLGQIQGCTYEGGDLDQRRLGLIADEVEEAIDQLAIDNVLGSNWHQVDWSPLIPAVNNLSARAPRILNLR